MNRVNTPSAEDQMVLPLQNASKISIHGSFKWYISSTSGRVRGIDSDLGLLYRGNDMSVSDGGVDVTLQCLMNDKKRHCLTYDPFTRLLTIHMCVSSEPLLKQQPLNQFTEPFIGMTISQQETEGTVGLFSNGHLKIWDLTSQSFKGKIPFVVSGGEDAFTHARYVPETKHILGLGYHSGKVSLVDARAGKVVLKGLPPSSSSSEVKEIEYSAYTIVTSHQDCTLQFWDTRKNGRWSYLPKKQFVGLGTPPPKLVCYDTSQLSATYGNYVVSFGDIHTSELPHVYHQVRHTIEGTRFKHFIGAHVSNQTVVLTYTHIKI